VHGDPISPDKEVLDIAEIIMTAPATTTCPVCNSSKFGVFFEMLDVPVFCNLLWPERDAAKDCPKGDIKLAFCSDCGFIYNVAFDPKLLDYCPDYENSLDFSPRFQDYAKSLADRLIQRYDLHDKEIIEIGCGKGDFLLLLCELGNNRGIGFDPSYIAKPDRQSPASDRVEFVRDFYSERYSDRQGDFVCCRHTLEHIERPNVLLNTLRKTVGDRLETPIFFEVPNALHTFHNLAIWDIIYEHCGYFAPVSLAYAFSASGFDVRQVTEEFQGQFLGLEAFPGNANSQLTPDQIQAVRQLASDIREFTRKFDAKIAEWKQKLEDIAANGQRVAIWGAGSKGVTFLNLLKGDLVEYIVDINPRKQGMYVPGTGQKIVPPEFLKEYRPDVAIVMNPIYSNEIQKSLGDLGLETELMSV
jgi:SAM-dependent methyltransferase